MPFTKYVELMCDGCGCCEHIATGSIKAAKTEAKQLGYIVEGNKLFCEEQCKLAYQIKSQKTEN